MRCNVSDVKAAFSRWGVAYDSPPLHVVLWLVNPLWVRSTSLQVELCSGEAKTAIVASIDWRFRQTLFFWKELPLDWAPLSQKLSHSEVGQLCQCWTALCQMAAGRVGLRSSLQRCWDSQLGLRRTQAGLCWKCITGRSGHFQPFKFWGSELRGKAIPVSLPAVGGIVYSARFLGACWPMHGSQQKLCSQSNIISLHRNIRIIDQICTESASSNVFCLKIAKVSNLCFVAGDAALLLRQFGSLRVQQSFWSFMHFHGFTASLMLFRDFVWLHVPRLAPRSVDHIFVWGPRNRGSPSIYGKPFPCVHPNDSGGLWHVGPRKRGRVLCLRNRLHNFLQNSLKAFHIRPWTWNTPFHQYVVSQNGPNIYWWTIQLYIYIQLCVNIYIYYTIIYSSI